MRPRGENIEYDKLRDRYENLAAERRAWAVQAAEDLARIAALEAALADMTADYYRSRDELMELKYPDGGKRVRQAHSKSEYKRLTALGVECTPPEPGSAANATAPGEGPSRPANGTAPGTRDGDLACPAALPSSVSENEPK